jgi:enoyl-CoA hydratase
MPDESTVTVEQDGHVLLMGLNRPAKRNAFNRAMLADLGRAYARLDSDPQARCGLLFAHGDHFTGGLDLVDVAPTMADGDWQTPDGGIDFLGLITPPVSKPVVTAIQGRCLTIGIELALASDVRVAATDARFAQIEIKRGIMPIGGATIRFIRDCGWGNAMMHLLTADEFSAAEAYRIGLVQEVVEPDRLRSRALEIAALIARQAPLGVQATLRNSRTWFRDGEAAAIAEMAPAMARMLGSDDAREGLQAFVERRDGNFTGR